MAFENFTTYTEFDEKGSVSVAANRIDIDTLTRDEIARVFKDFGVDFFDGDFEHRTHYNMSFVGNPASVVFHWQLANVVKDGFAMQSANDDYLALRFLGQNIRLVEFDNSTLYEDIFAISLDTDYYTRIIRDESIGTYGTLSCLIYSDAERTTLVDTLSVTLHTSKKDFRYLYAVNTLDTGSVEPGITAFFENYDLQLVAFSGFPFFFDSGHF